MPSVQDRAADAWSILLLRMPLFAPIGLAAGAAYYLTALTEPSWSVLAAALAAALVLYAVALVAGRSLLAILFLSFAMAPAGAAVAKARAHYVAAPVLSAQLGPVRVEGALVEIDSNDNNARLRLDVDAISDLPRTQTPKFVRFSYRYPIDLKPGRRLSCPVILLPPPGPVLAGDYAFDRDAWFERLGAVGYAVGRCEPTLGTPHTSILEAMKSRLSATRRAIAEHVVSIRDGPGAAFAAAVVTGDRSFFDTSDVEALRGSGLAHLLAISGLHMALVGGALFAGLRLLWPLLGPVALKYPAVKVAALGAIIGCTMYYLLSGGSVATQRAYIMALIALSAKLLDKPALSIRSLVVAFTILVLLRPQAVITPGFQMSFAASATLIGAFESWPQRASTSNPGALGRAGAWLMAALLTSTAASLATTPFAVYHFDRTAILSIPANLAATPIVSFWAAPAGAAALLAAPMGWQDPFLRLLSDGLSHVLTIAHLASDLAPMHTPNPIGGWVLALMVCGTVMFAVFPGIARLLSVLPIAVGGALWVGTPKAVGYVSSDGRIYLNTTSGWREEKIEDGSGGLTPLKLADMGVTEICDAKHIGPCRLQMEHGEIELAYTPATRLVRITDLGTGEATEFPIATSTPASGALYHGPDGYDLKRMPMQTGRPWSQ